MYFYYKGVCFRVAVSLEFEGDEHIQKYFIDYNLKIKGNTH